MPTVQVPVQLTVDHLMMAIKQLSPAEWHELMQQLAAWQQAGRAGKRPVAPQRIPAWYWRWQAWRLQPFRVS